MLLQLTSLGRSLLDADPVSVDITRVEFGNEFNYALPEDPTGLQGSVVYTSHLLVPPVIVSTVSVRYTIVIPLAATPFDFGEIAFYNQADLIAVAVNPTLIRKEGPIPGQDGKPLTLEFFFDLTPGNRYATGDQNGSFGGLSFPRIPIPDLLTPPAKNENNAFVIYGQSPTDQAYFAFADPTGKWGFSTKSQTFYSGTVQSAGAYGMQATGLVGDFSGPATELVLQFTTGKLRGYCRVLTGIDSLGAIQWNTPFTSFAEADDDFVIVGPPAVLGGNTSELALTVKDEGVTLGLPATVDTLNFLGSSIEATRVGNQVNVTVTPAPPAAGLPVVYRFLGSSGGTISFNDTVFESLQASKVNPASFVSWDNTLKRFDFDHAGAYRITINVRVVWENVSDSPGFFMYGSVFDGEPISLYNYDMTPADWIAHGYPGDDLRCSDTFTTILEEGDLSKTVGVRVGYTAGDQEGTVYAEVLIEEIEMSPEVYVNPPVLI